jgi:hypothetical protein
LYLVGVAAFDAFTGTCGVLGCGIVRLVLALIGVCALSMNPLAVNRLLPVLLLDVIITSASMANPPPRGDLDMLARPHDAYEWMYLISTSFMFAHMVTWLGTYRLEELRQVSVGQA